MPQVPGLIPDVEPTTQGAPNVSINAPVDAFGGAVGTALATMGGDIVQDSDKIWQRAVEIQDTQNRTEADKADTDYMQKAGMLHANFSALQGDAATAAFPQYIKDLNSAREDIKGKLSNPAVQRMFDSQSQSTMGRTIFNAAGHAAEQTKQAAINSISGRIQAQIDIAATSENPAEISVARNKITALNTMLHQQKGTDDPESVSESEKVINSSLDFNVVKQQSRKDPWQAKATLEARRSSMTAADYDRAQAIVDNSARTVGATNIANEVLSDNTGEDGKPEASMQEMEQQAKDKADKFAPHDAVLAQHAVQTLHGLWNQKKYSDRQQKYDNTQAIDDAIQNGNNGDGVKDIQDLRNQPGMADAIDNLSKADQLKLPARINNYNVARDKVHNQEAMTSIMGMRATDPVKFLDMDPTDPKVGLSQPQMREVMGWQRQDKKQSQADPRVFRALSILLPQMNAAGIHKQGGADTPETHDYYQFVGALQDQLDAYHKANPNKTPSIDDVKKLGSQLMQQQITSKGYLWDSKSATYQMPVPDDAARVIRNDPYWDRNNITPNDSMIQRIYAAQQFKKLYGGSAKGKSADVQFPPNAPTVPTSQ